MARTTLTWDGAPYREYSSVLDSVYDVRMNSLLTSTIQAWIPSYAPGKAPVAGDMWMQLDIVRDLRGYGDQDIVQVQKH